MKRFSMILSILAVTGVSAYSQIKERVKNSGCWVIESTVQSPRIQTVKFYDGNRRLVYQETVYKKLNISKAKVRAKLDSVLNRVVDSMDLSEKKNMLALSLKN